MTLSRRRRKRSKYKDKLPTERKGILRSQQRGSAALRIMSRQKLREMFGAKHGGRARRRRRRKDGSASGSQSSASKLSSPGKGEDEAEIKRNEGRKRENRGIQGIKDDTQSEGRMNWEKRRDNRGRAAQGAQAQIITKKICQVKCNGSKIIDHITECREIHNVSSLSIT